MSITPVYREYYNNNTLIKEYRLNGKLHHYTKPARTFIDDEGNTIKEEYYNMGKLYHQIIYDEDRIFRQNFNDFDPDNKTEKYFENGKLHRVDGPAKITTKGENRREEYYIHGLKHRIDGPAEKSYYYAINRFSEFYEEVFQVNEEVYYVNGEQHRMDGPSLISLRGDIEYSICGYLIDEKHFYKVAQYVKLVREILLRKLFLRKISKMDKKDIIPKDVKNYVTKFIF